MNILLITAYFPPEVGSASHLFYELGKELALRGNTVTVLTGFPKYNVGAEDLPQKYRRRLWLTEEIDQMKVIRVWTLGMPRHIPMLRGLDQFISSFTFVFPGAATSARHRIDIVIIYSPPLFLGLTGIVLRSISRVKLILNVQDLFPQSAIDLNVLRNKLLIRIFKAVESFVYRNVDAVTVHSPGNRDHVIAHGCHEDRTFTIHNPVDTKAIKPGKRDNAFRTRNGFGNDDYIVSFAGVIGYSQDLDTVIDTADRMNSNHDVVFCIVGDGVEKPRLLRKAEGLTNVRFLPMVKREEYTELLAASDLCLVTLHKAVRTPVVPSKILNIMASGRPIVAALPLQGDAPALVRLANCGICIEPEAPQKMSEAIEYLYMHPEVASMYGSNGRRYAEQHLSLESCALSYIRLFNTLCEDQVRGSV